MTVSVAQMKDVAEPRSFLQELDDAILRGSPESRLRALWHATDLLLTGRYTEDEIRIFGDVIGRLADEIETVTRAELSRRLTRTGNAPVAVVNRLALDEAIDVAGPILQFSERIDTRTLLETARVRSQDHLLAIARRKSVGPELTDVLVTRGNWHVAHSVTVNRGARFSEFGFISLVKRCDDDAILAEHLGLRRDIPRQVFQQLIAKASDEVRKKLVEERPDLGDQVQISVADVTYAQGHKHNETMIALSLLCALPINVVERVLLDSNRSMVLVLAKAMNFSWQTTTALLFLCAPGYRISTGDYDDLKGDFAGLNVATSRSILRFYQTRKQAAQA
jgi:hypothetical protein